MSASYAVTDEGAQRWSVLLDDEVKLLAERPRRDGSAVKASVELRRNGSLIHQDNVTLTSARSRNGFVADIESQRPGEFPDLSSPLLALSARVREIATTTRAAAAPAEPPDLTNDQRDELRQRAAPILDSPDPWALIRDALKQGYGGNPIAPETVYLAMTTRLLLMREGEIPGHLAVLGPSSAGKTYAVSRAARLMPREALVEYEAGSSRVLIYDDRPLRHRAVIFGEADSLPKDEQDSPAASALRGLLQNHRLVYKVTVRDPETGKYVVLDRDKVGPTVLITTATRAMPYQLGTRTFTLDMPDDPQFLRSVLEVQAALEREPLGGPDPALVAFQSYLQSLAPWDVFVPYAGELAASIQKCATDPRAFRDYKRLLAFIKAMAVIRHASRVRSETGRLVATDEDYAAVYGVVAPLYEEAISGSSQKVRDVVQAVEAIKRETLSGPLFCTYRLVAERLGITQPTAKRRCEKAQRLGWIENKARDEGKGVPADLHLGEPMPEPSGLPKPDSFSPLGGLQTENNGITVVSAGSAGQPSFEHHPAAVTVDLSE
jgi:hypothetical protein